MPPMNHHHSFIHSSPNPLSLLSKHPASFPILTSQTRKLAFCTGSPRALIHLQCVVLLYSSNLISPPPQTLQEHLQSPFNLLFHTGRYHAGWAVEQVPTYSLPPLQSARCTRNGAGHMSSLLLPHEPRPVHDPSRRRLRARLPQRLAPPGMQGALGKSVGAPRCPTPRLRPESNPTPQAPILGAPRPPHLCARPRSQLRSRRGPPSPP